MLLVGQKSERSKEEPWETLMVRDVDEPTQTQAQVKALGPSLFGVGSSW